MKSLVREGTTKGDIFYIQLEEVATLVKEYPTSSAFSFDFENNEPFIL